MSNLLPGFLRSPAHLHAQVDTYNWHIIMNQGCGNLAWECVCLDDARLVKVKQLLMSWRCMPADMKNLLCWPKGSKECWWGKLEACDYSLKHAALGMMSYLHMTRTSTVTSRQWSYIRTASAKLRDRDVRRKREEGGVLYGDQTEVWTAPCSIHLCGSNQLL